MDKDISLEDRMKVYELAEAGRMAMPKLPIMARLDGRAFHRFTEDMHRPYEESMSSCMIGTAKYLLEETQAVMAYTQSDEIILCWYAPDLKTKVFFNGRFQKLVSILAAMASVEFSRQIGLQNWGLGDDAPLGTPRAMRIRELLSRRPMFDARVWNVPTLDEAANAFLWRERDATKNSVSMAARAFYSHNEVDNKNRSEMHEMLFQKGVNWDKYPTFFKRGTFIQKRKVVRAFKCDEIEKLSPRHAARTNPNLMVERQDFVELEMPPFDKVTNRVAVIFCGVDPTVAVGEISNDAVSE